MRFSTTRRDARLVARVLFTLPIAATFAACHGAQPARKMPPTPVRVAAARRIDAPVTLNASGVVEPMQTVSVTAQVSGSLRDVLFTEGQFVQAGQLLFEIDPRPLQAAVEQARANLARDQAQAEASRRDDTRYKTLADMGYVSREQSDQMHATALAQAASVRADEAALRAAEVNLGFTAIRAPIAGKTGSLLVRKGNNVGPSTGPLVVINQLSPVLVRFPVLSQDFAPLSRAVAAHPLTVTAVSSDSGQTSEQGTLSFLDNAIDSLTGTVTGKASFPNVGRRLWPGELVFLTIEVDVERGVIAVPTDAIQTGQQGPYVFVIDARNTAQQRPVVPGLQVADLTVVQRGLAENERVVIDGQSRLNTGSGVAITSTGTDTGTVRLGAAAPTTGTAAGEVARPGMPGSLPPGSNPGGGPVGGRGPSSTTVPGAAPGATPGAVQSTIPAGPTVGAAAATSGRGANAANAGAAATTTTAPGATTPGTAAPTTAIPIVGPPGTAPTTGASGASGARAPTTGTPTTGRPATGTPTSRPPTTGTPTGTSTSGRPPGGDR